MATGTQYEITEADGKFAVKAGDVVHGTHDTREAAEAQANDLRKADAARAKGHSMGGVWIDEGSCMTGPAEYHRHKYDGSDQYTEPPVGNPSGHRHEILRDASGIVTGFGEADGHTHPMGPSLEEEWKQAQGRSGGTEEGDMRQHAAADDKPELHDVEGVEIFKAGTWNGDKYTLADLDAMVDAFDKVGYKPPVKLGHTDEPGARAWGWVKALKRVGDKLLADFMDVPAELYKLIKERAFDAVSSEIYWDLERDGSKYKRALKAVALLGADVPAVSGLAPLRTVVNSALRHGKVAQCTTLKESNMSENHAEMAARLADMETRLAQAAEAQAASLAEAETAKANAAKLAADAEALRTQLAANETRLAQIEEANRVAHVAAKVGEVPVPSLRPAFHTLYDLASRDAAGRVAKYTQGDTAVDYTAEQALDVMVSVLRTNAAKLFSELSAQGETGQRTEGPVATNAYDAGVEANKRTLEYMAKNKGVKYGDAMRAVFDADEDLKRAYAAAQAS